MSEELDIEEAIEQYGFAVRPFKGVSMLPLLVEGRDAVKLVSPKARLKKYDIALFKRKNGDLVLHRVVSVCGGYYVIRGDNCIRGEKVYDSQIIAVAEGVFLDGVYHDCSEKKIGNYALRQKLTLPGRSLKYYARAAARHALARLKKK